MSRPRVAAAIASMLIALIVLPFTAPFQIFSLNGQPESGTRRGLQLSLAADDDGPAVCATVVEHWRTAAASMSALSAASFFALVVAPAPSSRAAAGYTLRPPSLDALRI